MKGVLGCRLWYISWDFLFPNVTLQGVLESFQSGSFCLCVHCLVRVLGGQGEFLGKPSLNLENLRSHCQSLESIDNLNMCQSSLAIDGKASEFTWSGHRIVKFPKSNCLAQQTSS